MIIDILMWIVVLIFVGFLIYKDNDNNDDDNKNDNPYKKRQIDYRNPNKGKINVRGIWY